MQNKNYQFTTILQSRYGVHLIGFNNTINSMISSHFITLKFRDPLIWWIASNLEIAGGLWPPCSTVHNSIHIESSGTPSVQDQRHDTVKCKWNLLAPCRTWPILSPAKQPYSELGWGRTWCLSHIFTQPPAQSNTHNIFWQHDVIFQQISSQTKQTHIITYEVEF